MCPAEVRQVSSNCLSPIPTLVNNCSWTILVQVLELTFLRVPKYWSSSEQSTLVSPHRERESSYAQLGIPKIIHFNGCVGIVVIQPAHLLPPEQEGVTG